MAVGVPMSAEEFLKLCESGTPQQVQAAIDDGADVNARTKKGETALMCACIARVPNVVSVLLEAGADVLKRLR